MEKGLHDLHSIRANPGNDPLISLQCCKINLEEKIMQLKGKLISPEI